MVAPLAIGVPYRLGGEAAGWDLKPALAWACSLFLLRSFVGVRISWAIVVACLLVGTVFSTLIDAWGVVPATSLALTIALLLRLVIQHRRRGLAGEHG